jgi:mono/diheme cytochrome c family protein
MCSRELFVTLALTILAAGLGVTYLRVHGLSARAKPSALEIWLARRVRSLATPSSVRDLVNPMRANDLFIAEARDHFADHCAFCHGNRGDGKTSIGEGLFPPPPDLRAEETQSLSDGEIFNIIKNGIRFTGMPGFGGSDEDNWKLTLFIRHLPSLSDEERKLMNEINRLEGTHHDQAD